ncbi:hypothetical protein BH20ACI4_BH20ACI4_05970 [soil metagenome]
MKIKTIFSFGLLIALAVLFQSSAQAQTLPTPQIKFTKAESYEANGKQWIRYILAIVNHSDYSNELFAAAPDLPPCGENKNSSRSWISVYNKQKKKVFCALKSAEALDSSLWFAIEKGETPPESLYITITDRRNKTTAKSNEVAVAPPNKNNITKMDSNVLQRLLDLSMRDALYFTGAKTDKIDLKNDKYAVKDGTMELKKSQATSCDGDTCEFNIGFIAFRSGNTNGELSTYALFQVEKGGLVGNTVYFADGEKTKQAVHSVKLKMGMNKVTFTIDPYKKTAETDENNNSFSVNFKVTP